MTQAYQQAAGQRALLFSRLHASLRDQGKWDEVFRLMGQGRMAAERAQMAALADQFEAGQEALLQVLRDSDQFLPWELELIQLGLACGNVADPYRRLAEHYHQLDQAVQNARRYRLLPTAIYLFTGWALPAALVLDGHATPLAGLLLACLPLLLLGAAMWAGRGIWRAWQRDRVPRRLLAVLYRIPPLSELLRLYQIRLYLDNLSLCIESGQPLERALKLAARRLPYSPWRRRFSQIHQQVEAGGRLSVALLNSGILQGVMLPTPGPGTDAAAAQRQLTDVVRATYAERLAYWARWQPASVLLLVPLVVLVDLLAVY